jgi:hypothetical protein
MTRDTELGTRTSNVESGIILLSSLLLAMGTACLAADPMGPYPFFKAIAAPESPAKKIAAFALDEEILAATDNSYANLRVFDDKGTEIPSLVRCKTLKKTVVRERSVPMNTAAFNKLADNRIEIVVSAKEGGHTLSAVVFHTGLRNFEKQVTVSGSQDQQSWTILAEAKPVFDYSKFIDLRNSRVEFTAGQYSFYKIEISNITESHQSPLVQIVKETKDGALASEVEKTSFTKEDFRIEKMEFLEKLESILESDRVMRPYAVQNLVITNLAKAKTTVVTFDTPSVPLTELQILTPQVNFSRSLSLEGRNDEMERRETGTVTPAWQPIASSTISRIDIGKFQQTSTSLSLGSAKRFRHYRLTIYNLDSPPLDIAGMEAKGEVHEALFFCEPSRTYRTFYGAKDQPMPRYDIAAVLTRTEGADTDTFSAGRQEPNPSYKPDDRISFSGKKMLVPSVILMVVTLVWLIARTIKRVDPA